MSGLMPFGPLAYQGTIAVPYIVRNFPPTTKDFNFNVPTVWIDPSNNFAWMLTSKPDNVADWLPFISGGGDITFLRGNDNLLVSATTSGIVNVIGDDTTIRTFRNPDNNSLTISAIGSTAFTWVDASGTISASASTGYFATGAMTADLPSSPSLGETIGFCNLTGAPLAIIGGAGQTLKNGSTPSQSARTMTSNAEGDSIIFIYNDTATTWFAVPGSSGAWFPS